VLAPPDSVEASGGRPFDVREYEAAAIRVADASRDLRALATELRDLDATAVRATIDHATWRAAILVCVFFAALAAYRLLVSRLRPREA
jgi:hypothetical protein